MNIYNLNAEEKEFLHGLINDYVRQLGFCTSAKVSKKISKQQRRNSKIPNVVIQILRMTESNNNVQFFVRAKRTNVTGIFEGILEYNCFQTKHGLSIDECISSAIFSSSSLLRFFGLRQDQLSFENFPNEEQPIIEKYRKFWLKHI